MFVRLQHLHSQVNALVPRKKLHTKVIPSELLQIFSLFVSQCFRERGIKQRLSVWPPQQSDWGKQNNDKQTRKNMDNKMAQDAHGKY